jgi:hypothetical protein
MSPRSPDFKRNKSITDLISDTRKPKLLPETGWYRIAITELFEGAGVGGQYIGSTLAVFINGTSWANVAGISNPPTSWYLSEDGEVRMRGKIKGGAGTGETIFTLPEEVRPEYTETFIVPINDNDEVDLSGIKYRAFINGGI